MSGRYGNRTHKGVTPTCLANRRVYLISPIFQGVGGRTRTYVWYAWVTARCNRRSATPTVTFRLGLESITNVDTHSHYSTDMAYESYGQHHGVSYCERCYCVRMGEHLQAFLWTRATLATFAVGTALASVVALLLRSAFVLGHSRESIRGGSRTLKIWCLKPARMPFRHPDQLLAKD